jgi:exopolysaccharide biosynthesis protein
VWGKNKKIKENKETKQKQRKEQKQRKKNTETKTNRQLKVGQPFTACKMYFYSLHAAHDPNNVKLSFGEC